MEKLRPLIAEFLGTFALIFIGIGAIFHMGRLTNNAGLLTIALAHGLTIAVMVSATGHISGGQLNPAVTVGVFVAGRMRVGQVVGYIAAQLAGATLAAFICLLLFSAMAHSAQFGREVVQQGTPQLSQLVLSASGSGGQTPITFGQGVIVEAILTFFLVFVVLGTAVDPRGPKIGGLAIGLTVTLDILFGGPLTGAAMNPARTFGPALASGFWKDHLVYWIGPLLGGVAAGLVYGRLISPPANV
jgi:aquaporin TIP